ncbi:MAG: hypothetical protein DMG39_21435 [Acidobacteria bacterium]|nr:MAG: hypothetical protein DMG39_21435 [Acidobacteriota bacterium]
MTQGAARREDGRIYFGIGDCREEVTPASQLALKPLLQDLELHRHPLGTDTRHALDRAQPERRLESLVREDVASGWSCGNNQRRQRLTP